VLHVTRHFKEHAMRCGTILTTIAFGIMLAAVATRPTSANDGAKDLLAIARELTAGDPALVDAAVARLRAGGPAELHRLLQQREVWVARDEAPVDLERLDEAIDRVGGQRYCTTSRLFWYTDLEQAQAAARTSGRPILSLRLLGNLTDELSCANSRFFRTTLYANQQISAILRERFVLHWKSVRPVPKVTIDFGDGRVVRRTLTGNSIHYVLDADGRVLDGLPGLHGPEKFKAWLNDMAQVAETLRESRTEAFAPETAIRWYHEDRLRQLARQWQADINRLRTDDRQQAEHSPPAVAANQGQDPGEAPRAAEAAPIARPKAILEIPLLNNVMNQMVRLEADTDSATWERLAALHAAEARLDDASRALIRRQNPAAANAMKLAITKSRVEDPVLRIVGNLQESIALDTVRNEYLLHRRLHEWFALNQPATHDIETLNERVYAELFLTPRSDPWLGLMPAGAYSALQNDGLVTAQ
jgi:hypothetical protein